MDRLLMIWDRLRQEGSEFMCLIRAAYRKKTKEHEKRDHFTFAHIRAKINGTTFVVEQRKEREERTKWRKDWLSGRKKDFPHYPYFNDNQYDKVVSLRDRAG